MVKIGGNIEYSNIEDVHTVKIINNVQMSSSFIGLLPFVTVSLKLSSMVSFTVQNDILQERSQPSFFN